MENSDLTVPESKPDNPLSRAVIADENGIIYSARCHICKSKFRSQIEVMIDQNHPLPVIRKFLLDNGEDYQLWRLKHHFETHYKNAQNQAAIAEWRDRLGDMLKTRRNMMDDLVATIEVAWMELANNLAIETGTDIDKKAKRARMISDNQKTIKDGWDSIRSLHDGEAKARALEERFERVWKIKLETVKDENERKLLISTLKDFQEKLNQIGP